MITVGGRAQIQAFEQKKNLHTHRGLLGPYHQWGAVGTSTRAVTCVFTSEPQLSFLSPVPNG